LNSVMHDLDPNEKVLYIEGCSCRAKTGSQLV